MPDVTQGLHQLFLREEDLRQGMELLFFAYRDFTAEPDAILDGLGMGRAHHRVIHFVGRNPGIRVGELLAILKITKQSLSRVLKTLIQQGYIAHQQGAKDRRERRLQLSPKGEDLERRLSESQRRRIAAAYRAAGAAAVEGYRQVMLGLINETDRNRFAKTAAGAQTPGPATSRTRDRSA